MSDPDVSAKQLASIRDATARINVWHGAVRSGKTIASLLAFLLAIAVAPSSGLIIVVGRSLQTIERNVLDPLMDVAIFGRYAAAVQHTRGSNTATILGRTVHLIGAADARAEGRLRGLTACLAYVDEATLIPQEFWTQLLARLSVPGARLFATTNPDSPRHWLKVDYLDREADLNMRSWHFRLGDNHTLEPDYIRSLHAEYVGLWRRRMIDGAWVIAEGAVYDMLDDDRHIVTELPQITRWISCGVDYGTTNDFVALLVGLGADRRLYVAAEYRHASRSAHHSLTDAEYDRALRAFLQQHRAAPDWLVVDPSAASFIEQLHRTGMPNLAPAENGVTDGIRTVASLLSAGRLRIHASCVGLIKEMTSYSWDPRASDRGEDAPLKVDDHGPDALRYAIRTTEALWRPLVPTHLEVAA
ncbi:PBSX family phage terminase large subunit [Streptomyces sp. NPDC002467]|uniref:PBSX family phage terminase large subunit n=1 Tax=Streptomyces sp. NPDC002467 TaxID=3364647 RepID=UPI0036CC3731